MGWEKLKYDGRQVNNAGKVLSNVESSEKERNMALKILSNWRAVHSYPMHIFQMRLKGMSKKVDKHSLTAQRLKRIPAIIYKLGRSYEGRSPSMKLSQMQDIGGVRAVTSNVALARKLYNDHYLRGDLKHKRVGNKDYINNPKKDGYRSLHLVYEYKSDKGKKEYNGLRIEVQIRSKLQHLWATAVETVDFFTRQAIKVSEGQPEWADFFKLVSSAFAKMENCPMVPDTFEDNGELYLKIKRREKELKVITKMDGWTSAMRFFEEEKTKRNAQFFLLELDILGEKLSVKSFAKKEEQKAIREYSELESRHKERKDYDVVLVGADTIKDLKKAYPNYFVDTKEFLHYLKKILEKA